MIVIKNNVLGLIKWEQMVFIGNPEYGVRPAPDRLRQGRRRHAARTGYRIEDPASCEEQLREALAHDGPVVIECVVDPE